MTDEGAARSESTIADAERIIRKIEACSGMAAKLVLLRNFIEFSASSSNAALLEANQVIRRQLQRVCDQVQDEQKAHELIAHYLIALVGTADGTSVSAAQRAAAEIEELRDSRDRLQEALREAGEDRDEAEKAVELLMEQCSALESERDILREALRQETRKAEALLKLGAALGDPEKESNG